ncbi:MAG TPA: hypothetical protein PK098_06675 [Phycisphaerales bacterium]|nr:hypothetical protein [Phycisphaerales bacterium]
MPSNNSIIRRVNLITTHRPLSTVSLIGNFTVRVPANATGIFLQTDDKVTEIALERSQQFTLEGVDLADISARGAVTDFLIVIGSSRFTHQ